MATISFNVSYTQTSAGNGSITLNDETKPASGRLDKVGDFIYADGFFSGLDSIYETTVECVRTSSTTMQIRIVFIEGGGSISNYCYAGCMGVEKIIDDVPINIE